MIFKLTLIKSFGLKAYVSHPSAGRGWEGGRRIAPIRRIAGEYILSLTTAAAAGRDDELR